TFALVFFFFFFSSRRRHTRFDCDWSSDVCSSDLTPCAVTSGPTRASSARKLCRAMHAASAPSNSNRRRRIFTKPHKPHEKKARKNVGARSFSPQGAKLGNCLLRVSG